MAIWKKGRGASCRGYKKDSPHSKQQVLNRDVIKPQEGHILCDLIPAICGFSLRILYSIRIMNRAISRAKKMLAALISVLVGNKGRVS
jgi:hypothetical protein